ncbi:MAG: GNAT family N-acetyltransferase [Alphaproteobacteria bacterium]|nr:GNAT family N-acetyltransferase [Alphaproteobacteria bacterium]
MTKTIREAQPGDEAIILEFIKELASYEKLSHEVIATEDHLKRTLFVSQPKAFALIAEVDGEPVGFALYFFNYSTFIGRHGLYLEDLYVRESMRGGGHGKALLSRLAQIALDNDCGRMDWSVLDWNAPSIAFYKSLGAMAMDEWTVFRLTGEALSNLAARDGK